MRSNHDVREWKEFLITDIFESIKRGKRLTKSNQILGTKPYVSSTGLNNGVDGFIGNDSGVRSFNNVLTIANSGSVGSTFYHEYEFIASDHVTIFENKKLTKYQYLYLSTLLERIGEKYHFNREINDSRIRREKIILPITKDGIPDWKYIDEQGRLYIKHEEQKVLDYIERRIQELKIDLPDSYQVSLEDTEWLNFEIGELFELKRGKRQKANDRVNGDLPYIGATKENNGVTDFISNPVFVDNCKIAITIFGDAFWLNFDFTAGDDVTLIGNDMLNQYNGLFIAHMITRNQSKFSFNYKAFSSRLTRLNILLPSKKEVPDWKFMEQYIKQLELEKLLDVKKYLNKKTK